MLTCKCRYCLSKALEVLFVRELVKHTSGKSPVITLVNPGLCHSEFQRNVANPLAQGAGWLLKALLARTTEVGSRTLVAGICTGPESNGEYMSDSKNQEIAGWMLTKRAEEVQRSVYGQTLAVLEGLEPGISRNI